MKTYAVMNNTSGSRGNLTKSVHMRHNIVSPLLLLDLGNTEIIIRNSQMLPHLRKRIISDTLNTKLFL